MRGHSDSPIRNLARKVALALGATLAALLLLELLLQASSLFVRDSSDAARGIAPAAGTVRVLCLGDSNTYGIEVERTEAWPARLEALWNAAGREPRIEVLNLGYPGTNSSQVLRDFERNLDLFQPRVVLVEVGSNDFWTVPVPLDASEPWSLLGWIQQSSRLYRLIYMATREPEDDRPVVEIDEGAQPERSKGSVRYQGRVFELGHTESQSRRPGIETDLENNLAALAAIAGARHVQLVFVTYASTAMPYPVSTKSMRRVARQTGTPLADLLPAFRSSVCPAEPCPEWIFPQSSPGKHHPTAKGYEVVAGVVLRTLGDVIARPEQAPGAAR